MLPPARRISALEARRLAPALAEGGLRGALLSWDGQLEDDARLVVAVARTAAAHGARILTYAGVTGVRDDGVDAVDALTGAAFSVRARHVILATGVWAGELSAAVELRPSRGSHLLVPAGRLGDPRAAVNVPVPGERGRWVFALPRADGLVAIGLTDVAADGPVPDEPAPSAEEEATLLEHASAALEVSLGPEDVAGRYAGLRPLLADGGSRPPDRGPLPPPRGRRGRRHGRADRRRRQAHDLPRDGAGRRRPHHGAAVPHRAAAARGRRRGRRRRPPRLARRFGAEAAAVAELGSTEPLAPGVPVCEAELRWAAAHELALTPEDLADRRTRAGLVPEWREVVLAAARATIPGCSSALSPPPTSTTSPS